MNQETLEKAKSLESEMCELKLDISGYQCMVNTLKRGKVVLHVEGIDRFSFKVDKDLSAYMIQHYQDKISNRSAKLELLKEQFKQL